MTRSGHRISAPKKRPSKQAVGCEVLTFTEKNITVGATTTRGSGSFDGGRRATFGSVTQGTPIAIGGAQQEPSIGPHPSPRDPEFPVYPVS